MDTNYSVQTRDLFNTLPTKLSIQFLAGCSNFCKELKNKFRRLSVRPDLRWSNDLHVSTISFLLVQGPGGSPTVPYPEDRVGDQDTGNKVPSAPCFAGVLGGGLDDSSRLHVTEITRVA